MSKQSPIPFSIPPRWRFPALLGIIVLLLFGASFVNKTFLNNDANTTNPLNTQQAKDILQECGFDAEVCNYIAAQTVAFQSGVTIESSFEDEATSNTFRNVFELDGNGNSSIMSYQDSELVGHLITLDGVVYMFDQESSSWYELGSTDGAPTQFGNDSPVDFVEDLLDENKSFRMEYLGDEACGSSQCKKYQIFSDDLVVDEEETEVFIWIEQNTSLMQRMLVQQVDTQIFMEYTYGPISIARPEPVVSFPGMMTQPEEAQEMINQFGGANGEEPTQEELEQYIRELGF